MDLKNHHKFAIGGFTLLVIIFMISSTILFYVLSTRIDTNYNNLNEKMDNYQKENLNKINTLTENIIQTKDNLNTLDTQLGSLGGELDLLKASAGEDFSGIIENSIGSVVSILTNVGQGTGFIISNEGYIVTNYHVIEGSSQIRAITSEQKQLSATLIGKDSKLDLALLKVSGNFNKFKLGNSDKVNIGEKVIAIGNPLGLQFSVSQGIISGIHRTGINGISGYFQTDTALNPGNSGGPLINKEGNVIGINNFKVGSGENLGFALESNYIKDSINQISEKALNQTLI